MLLQPLGQGRAVGCPLPLCLAMLVPEGCSSTGQQDALAPWSLNIAMLQANSSRAACELLAQECMKTPGKQRIETL